MLTIGISNTLRNLSFLEENHLLEFAHIFLLIRRVIVQAPLHFDNINVYFHLQDTHSINRVTEFVYKEIDKNENNTHVVVLLEPSKIINRR